MPHQRQSGRAWKDPARAGPSRKPRAIASSPNVAGFALFSIDASVVLHFDPEIALSVNGTHSMSCQSVASE